MRQQLPRQPQGAGDAGDYHGDDKEGHDRDGSDEAGDGHRVYRHPHFRPGYRLNTQDCFMLHLAFVACILVRTGETSRCIRAFDQLVARIKKRSAERLV